MGLEGLREHLTSIPAAGTLTESVKRTYETNYLLHFEGTKMRLPALFKLFLILVASIPLFAQGQQPTSGSVSGTVRLEDTHGPAVGAFVSLFSAIPEPTVPEVGEYVMRDSAIPQDLHARVASDGSFEIGSVPPGNYTVMLYHPGYIAQDPRVHIALPSLRSPRKVTVLSGQRKSLVLEMERGGSIEGRVTFVDGRPAHTGLQVAAEIAVNVEVETEPGKFSRFGGAAHTDSNGHYSIDSLPTGRYIVFTAFPGNMVSTTRGRVETTGRVIFAPSSVRASKAKIVEVQQPRDHGEVDIQVPTQGLYSVAGTVVDGSGKPITEGLIRLYPKGEPDLSLAAPPGTHGEFSFANLPDDEYTVRAESSGEVSFLGMTEDKTGMRMLRHKAPFAPVSTEVTLSGRDAEALVLRVSPTQ